MTVDHPGPRDEVSRVVRLCANACFGAVLVVVFASLLVWGGRGFPDQPMSFLRGPLGFIELAVIGLTFGGIGAFLATRLPGLTVGWSLIVIGLGVALHMPASLVVGDALGSFRPIPTMLLVSVWVLTSAFVPLAVTLIGYLLMILPDGHLPSRRWVYPLTTLVIGFHVLMTATALEPSGLVWFPTLPNPLGLPLSIEWSVAIARIAGVGLLVIGLMAASMAMVNRYRCGDAATRGELRWIAGGAVVWGATLAPFVVVRYVTGAPDEIGTVVILVAAAGTLAIPISIFVATTRHHLFGIQAIVSGTVVYVPLMAICGGLYAAGLALSQRLFVGLTGNTSDVAIILATLLMASAITPVRRLLEAAVERLSARARRSDAPGTTELGADYRELVDQARVLAARLAEVEEKLSAADSREPRDRGREVGEPGLGISVRKVDEGSLRVN